MMLGQYSLAQHHAFLTFDFDTKVRDTLWLNDDKTICLVGKIEGRFCRIDYPNYYPLYTYIEANDTIILRADSVKRSWEFVHSKNPDVHEFVQLLSGRGNTKNVQKVASAETISEKLRLSDSIQNAYRRQWIELYEVYREKISEKFWIAQGMQIHLIPISLLTYFSDETEVRKKLDSVLSSLPFIKQNKFSHQFNGYQLLFLQNYLNARDSIPLHDNAQFFQSISQYYDRELAEMLAQRALIRSMQNWARNIEEVRTLARNASQYISSKDLLLEINNNLTEIEKLREELLAMGAAIFYSTRDLSNNPVEANLFTTKPTYFMLTFLGCAPCKIAKDWIESNYQQIITNSGYQILTIVIGDTDRYKKSLFDKPAKWPHLFDVDGKIGNQLYIYSAPQYFVSDRYGQLINLNADPPEVFFAPFLDK
jgi:hypothetical protein